MRKYVKKATLFFRLLRIEDLLIILLILTAAVLSVKIYFQISHINEIKAQKDTVNSSTLLSNNPKRPNGTPRPFPSELSREEQTILTMPGQTATPQEKQKHFDLIKTTAVANKALDLNNCIKPNPLVIGIKRKAEFIINNRDSVDHIINIDKDHIIKLPKNQTVSVIADFNHPTGAFGYTCDNNPGIVGYIFVNP